MIESVCEVPELQMNRSLDAGLRDIAVVKGDVRKVRYADENKADDSEKKGSKVGFLSGLRDSYMERNERCVLELLAADLELEIDIRSYHCSPERRAYPTVSAHRRLLLHHSV